MTFVDTGVWFSLSLPEDPNHVACLASAGSTTSRLLTTDYVVDELLTLLSSRGYHDVAIAVGGRYWRGEVAELIRVTDEDLTAAWAVFQKFTDKRWSFTDCTSYAVMQRLGITEALALDDHFRQFGFCEVRP